MCLDFHQSDSSLVFNTILVLYNTIHSLSFLVKELVRVLIQFSNTCYSFTNLTKLKKKSHCKTNRNDIYYSFTNLIKTRLLTYAWVYFETQEFKENKIFKLKYL